MRIFSVTIDRDLITGWDQELDHVILLFNVRPKTAAELLLNHVSSLKH